MSTFNPYARTASWIAALAAKTTTEYDASLDPRSDGTVSDEHGEPIPVGTYLTDGSEGIVLKFSVGNGKGSTLVELSGNQLDGVATALFGWEVVDLDKLSPAECIRRTIGRDPETGEITFKVSLAKNSRTVTVPGAEWEKFLDYIDTGAASVGDAVAHYRAAVAEAEEAAAKAAADKAAKAAANAPK